MTMWNPKSLVGRGLPLYRALAQSIADAVDHGELQPGDQLPPQRELSGRLGIALATVTRGYVEAERLGLVCGEVGRGTFVRRPECTAPGGETDLRANALQPEPFLPELRQRLARVMTGASTAAFGYGPHRGAEDDRLAAAQWLSAEAGLSTGAEQVLVTGGAQHAMAVVFATVLDPGDTLLVEECTYSGMKSLANLLRIRLRALPTDDQGVRPDALAQACNGGGCCALYTIPTFQNPTATVIGDERRREVAAIANTAGLPVVEDDSYGFLLPGRLPLVALCENGYYLTGTSKALLPALRIGFVRSPSDMVERIEAAIASSVYLASPLMAAAVSAWIRDGTATRVVAWKGDEIEARQAIVRRHLPAELYRAPPTSPHGWLTLPEPWVVRDFVTQAAMRGVHVMPADYYAIGRTAPHAIRLCVGPPSGRPQLERAVETLATLLGEGPDAARVIV